MFWLEFTIYILKYKMITVVLSSEPGYRIKQFFMHRIESYENEVHYNISVFRF